MRKSLLKRLAIRLGGQNKKTTTQSPIMAKLLSIVVALMLSTTVSAVGMGGINVTSALGQSLKADIELVAISKTEKDSLVARLAAPDAYKNAGLEYPYGNKYKFEILNRANGQPYISATSAEAVNDPFVSLLVELTWSAGKLSREYTFLLDPPGYVAQQPAAVPVKTVAPQMQAPLPASATPPTSEATTTVPEQVAPVMAVTPAEQPAAEAAPAAAAAEQPAPEEAANAMQQPVPVEIEAETPAAPEVAAPKEWLEVHRGDTMYVLAQRYKLSDMNLERMLVALYRTNAAQFDGRNMNRIRAGRILHLPTQEEYDQVSQAEAVREIHAQAADWNAYRQKLAGAAVVNNEAQATQQVATGKISSSIADMAPVAKESAKEVLKLSKGEAPGDQVGAGGKVVSEQEKKNAAQEEAISKDKSLKEEQMRAALLEKNMKDMQRLAELKAETAASAQAPAPAQGKPAVTVATTNPLAVPPVKPAVQPPEAKPAAAKQAPVKAEPALLDQLLEEPLYMAGAALVLLVLGGLGYKLYQRKKNSADGDDGEIVQDIGDITGRMSAPVAPSPDTGDFTVMANESSATSAQSDTVDPISEADLFLNFGRDVQAEEILKEALQSTPNNHLIHLKLLGIYANRKDATAFATIARQLQGAGDDEAWQQAATLGRKLDPGNPMYGGGFKSMEDTGSATVQTPAFKRPEPPKPQPSALDFDFDANASAAPETSAAERDFLGEEAQRTSIMTADGNLAAQAEEMDFDITSSNPSVSGQGDATMITPSFADDMVFDVPDSQPSKAVVARKTEPVEDLGMAFTLDFPVEKPAAAPAPQADVGLAGINLNFDEPPLASAASGENKDEQWQDVATKLDLAKAYHEMGDASGAREILEEVLREGDAEQREAAQSLSEQLG